MDRQAMLRNSSYAPEIAKLPRSEKAYDRTPVAEPAPPKEERPCCLLHRDALGRLPVGFCSPACIGRPR